MKLGLPDSSIKKIRKTCSMSGQCRFYRKDTETCSNPKLPIVYNYFEPNNPEPNKVRGICPVDGQPTLSTYQEVKEQEGSYCTGYSG